MAIERVKITTVVDNAVLSGGFLAEWGFSLLVETDDANFVFDCGATPTPFFHNVRTLGVDLKQFDQIIISHGHHDHTGALDSVIEAIGDSPQLITGADAWRPRFYKDNWAGISHRRDYIESLGAKIVDVEGVYPLSEDIVCFTSIPMVTAFEAVDDDLLAGGGDVKNQDNFPDELAIAMKTVHGLVIITGCAHRGIVNIVQYAMDITGENRVYAIIGGSHLMRAGDARIEKTVQAFREMGVKHIALSHCTGDKATVKLARAFEENFIFNKAGVVLELS